MSKVAVLLNAARGGRMLTGSLAMQIVEPQSWACYWAARPLYMLKAMHRGRREISAKLSWSSKRRQRVK